jgi:hypothetical protein
MTRYWSAGIVLPFLLTAGALAQVTAPEPNRAADGPAGSVEAAHAGIVVAPSGVATGTTETFKKSQSYGNENGELTAKTRIETTGPVTTVMPK